MNRLTQAAYYFFMCLRSLGIPGATYMAGRLYNRVLNIALGNLLSEMKKKDVKLSQEDKSFDEYSVKGQA